jgi:hypothetical protein
MQPEPARVRTQDEEAKLNLLYAEEITTDVEPLTAIRLEQYSLQKAQVHALLAINASLQQILAKMPNKPFPGGPR